MREEIEKELARIESEYDVKVLLAVESGSRAWGFASEDSDWDVRYIYIHRPEWYLSIDQHKDSQEEILPNEIDLAGWEFRKALRLFRKANPPMLEWLRSPIVYLERFDAAAELRQLSETYFDPRACMYHYLSMAKGNFNEFLRERELVKIKKYFYVLRPVLACDWIESRNEFPPMEFEKLILADGMGQTVLAAIDDLLKRKKAGEELKEEPKIPVLNDFLWRKIEHHTKAFRDLNTIDKRQTEELNSLFRSTLNEVWN